MRSLLGVLNARLDRANESSTYRREEARSSVDGDSRSTIRSFDLGNRCTSRKVWAEDHLTTLTVTGPPNLTLLFFPFLVLPVTWTCCLYPLPP